MDNTQHLLAAMAAMDAARPGELDQALLEVSLVERTALAGALHACTHASTEYRTLLPQADIERIWAAQDKRDRRAEKRLKARGLQ